MSLEAIEAIHVDWQSGTRLPGQSVSADAARHLDLTPKTITAFLVGLKSRMAIFGMQRQINEYEEEPLLAILPGVTLQQLWGLVGIAENALLIVALLVVAAGLLGMLTALLTTLNERRREMAILRSIGARPSVIFSLLILGQPCCWQCGGIVAGVGLLYAGLFSCRAFIESHYGLQIDIGIPDAQELLLLAIVFGAGLIAGSVPALLACKAGTAFGWPFATFMNRQSILAHCVLTAAFICGGCSHSQNEADANSGHRPPLKASTEAAVWPKPLPTAARALHVALHQVESIPVPKHTGRHRRSKAARRDRCNGSIIGSDKATAHDRGWLSRPRLARHHSERRRRRAGRSGECDGRQARWEQAWQASRHLSRRGRHRWDESAVIRLRRASGN